MKPKQNRTKRNKEKYENNKHATIIKTIIIRITIKE